MASREMRKLERDINRMRRVLDLFKRMDRTDRWYVLTRIAQSDDPAMFRQVDRGKETSK